MEGYPQEDRQFGCEWCRALFPSRVYLREHQELSHPVVTAFGKLSEQLSREYNVNVAITRVDLEEAQLEGKLKQVGMIVNLMINGRIAGQSETEIAEAIKSTLDGPRGESTRNVIIGRKFEISVVSQTNQFVELAVGRFKGTIFVARP